MDDVGSKSLHELKSIISAVSVIAGRATFLAGFTYYQIGRYNFTPGSDTASVVFNTSAFVFSVLSAAISAFIGYYSPRGLFLDDDKRAIFVTHITPFSRICFQMYQLALILHSLGICQMGFVYYPHSSSKYIPFIMFLLVSFCTVIVIYGYIVKSYLYLEEKIHGVEEVKDRIATILYNYSNADQPIEEKLKLQCDIISGRALYIAGMAQNGILRYLPPGFNHTSMSKTYYDLGRAFLVFSCLATGSALLCSTFLSVISIFINDAQSDKKRSISILFEPIAKACFKAYASSFIFIAFMIILMPFGCDYSQQAICSILCGTIALISIIGCMYFSNNAYVRSNIDTKSNQVASDHEKLTSQRILLKINNTGSQATLTSAFIFYNILTQYTDVLEWDTQSFMTELWIFINVFSVTTSLLAAIFDSIVSFYSTIITSHRGRFMYLQRTRGIQILISVFFYVSLGGWFILFGMLGFTKFYTPSYIPVVFTVIFGLLTMAGRVYLESAYSVASIDLECKEGNTESTLKRSFQHKNKSSRLNAIAFKVLFLGGFAYNAVVFFQFQGLSVDNVYLTFMSATFCISLTVVSWAFFYNIKIYDCLSEELQNQFSYATHSFYEMTCALAALVLILLLCGFSLLGLVKNRKFYTHWRQGFPIMTATAALALSACAGNFYLMRNKYLSSSKIKEVKVIKDEYVSKHILDQIEVASAAASFVAGNVCYEILFTQTLSHRGYNFMYMAFNNSTFFAGVFTVAYSIQANYFLGELDSEAKKLHFLRLLRKEKGRIFVVSTSMLGTWLLAIILLGKVKYISIHAMQSKVSMIIGIIGTVLFLFFAYRIKWISKKYVHSVGTTTPTLSSDQEACTEMNIIHQKNRINDS